KGYFANQRRPITTYNTSSPLQNWYQKSTVPGLNSTPPHQQTAIHPAPSPTILGFYQELCEYPP
ncbi:hypothetical protein LSH36_217g05050, partial [Paralvinella palmiformis]